MDPIITFEVVIPTGTRASDSYGYDQSSDINSIAYRGFGYYQHGVEPEQPLRSYFPNYESSQSSQSTHSSNEQLFQPHSHYANYHPDLYAYRRTNDDDDFEPPHHSIWYLLMYLMTFC